MPWPRNYFNAFTGTDEPGPIGQEILSTSFHLLACDMSRKAREETADRPDTLKYSRYVHACVILRVCCIEAYFNENLSRSMFFIEKSSIYSKEEKKNMKAHIDILMRKTLNKEKIKEIFSVYDKTRRGIDVERPLYREFCALIALRHALAHYTPEFVEHARWPVDLREAARLNGLFGGENSRVMRQNWVSAFGNVKVADWSYRASKALIEEFSRVTGAINPYWSPKPDWPVWTVNGIESSPTATDES